MLSRRAAVLAVPAALTALARPGRAAAEPRVGWPFPPCRVRDLQDRWRSPQDLAGRRTLVIAITGTGAGDGLNQWMSTFEARRGRAAPVVAMVALALPFFAWDGIVRSQARVRTPRWRWADIWLDRDGVLQRALGLAHDNNVPWAYVVERNMAVSAATHALPNHPSASPIWAALAAP
jgi:hypothetical protein